MFPDQNVIETIITNNEELHAQKPQKVNKITKEPSGSFILQSGHQCQKVKSHIFFKNQKRTVEKCTMQYCQIEGTLLTYLKVIVQISIQQFWSCSKSLTETNEHFQTFTVCFSF